ncbi:MAG TPA: aminoglycoside 6-adenylyltransferase [Dehalococcoidia bacterium]
MGEPDWRSDAITTLTRLLETDDDVVALVLFGSLAGPPENVDEWSDIDVLVSVRKGAMERFFPSPDWLRPIGEIWAYEAIAKANTRVLLVSFDAHRRIDIVIFEDADVDNIALWPDNPFRGFRRVLFSRSVAIDRAVRELHSAALPAPRTAVLDSSADRFWMAAETAVRKVVRGDLLIASHLALDLVRRCMEREMQLRDVRANTSHHPHGSDADGAILERTQSMLHPLTGTGVLTMIAEAAVRYDELEVTIDPNYTARSAQLLAMIDSARRTT